MIQMMHGGLPDDPQSSSIRDNHPHNSAICRQNRILAAYPQSLPDRFHPCDGRRSHQIFYKMGNLGNMCVLR
jgi:hypothetical protein